ncbi:MAG: Gfo/Idh/MocA family oxidoreductase [Lachnospiraceae bacterium]|nr:Gfo/Idh/MocA family oxidoreductase [Lachnospiraceae bacterium]
MKKYSVVIVGAGNIGAFFDTPDSAEILTHANAFYKNENFILKGFYDVDTEKAKEAAARWQVQAFESLADALENTDVVSCTVPDAFHFAVLKQVAEFPVKLVFAEKPFTKTEKEAEELCRLYEEKKIPVLINYTRRYVTEFMELKGRISEFGRFIRGTGYYGKGILHNGSHMIDFINYLLGDVSLVESADAFVDFEEDDPSVEAKLRVAEGVFYMHPLDCNIATLFELDLLFEKGRIRMTDGCGHVEESKVLPSPTFEGYYNYIPVKDYSVHYDSSFRNAVQHIYQVLEKQEKLLCSKEDGTKVLKLCRQLQRGGDIN